MSKSNNYLHIHKLGTGPKTVILFHGFGQTGNIFEDWFSALSATHTVYAFDLYYHGQSHRIDTQLSHKEWNADFQRILQQEGIETYHLVTFSLGGRFALSIMRYGLTKPSLLIMLAPDGFLQNFYQRLATNPFTNPLFRYLMNRPAQFDRVVNWIATLGIAPSGMIRFAKSELKAPDSRIKVYKTWTYFKNLQLSQNELEQLLIKNDEIHLILGSEDQIVSAKKISNRYAHLKDLQIHLLPSKHNQLIDDSKSLVASLLQGENL